MKCPKCGLNNVLNNYGELQCISCGKAVGGIVMTDERNFVSANERNKYYESHKTEIIKAWIENGQTGLMEYGVPYSTWHKLQKRWGTDIRTITLEVYSKADSNGEKQNESEYLGYRQAVLDILSIVFRR